MNTLLNDQLRMLEVKHSSQKAAKYHMHALNFAKMLD